MSAVTRLAPHLVLAVVVLLAAACSDSETRVYTAESAGRIAEVGPAVGGWAWPAAAVARSASTTADSGDGADDPERAEYRRQTAGLEQLAEEGAKWRDDDKLASLDVQVFRTAADAEKGLAALNGYSRRWAERYGTVTKAGASDGPGDDAWVLWVGGSGTQVTYHWRRDNLVLETHVHCFASCAGDVDAAARAWADAVDRAARESDA